jgi:cytochrome bd-type quinol oxidase subunit 1
METFPPITPPPMPPTEDSRGKAMTGMILGIVGIFAWCIPCLGLPITITGLVFSIKGLKSTGRGMAVAGVVLNIIGLILGIINAAVGAYLGATGRNPWINQMLHH